MKTNQHNRHQALRKSPNLRNLLIFTPPNYYRLRISSSCRCLLWILSLAVVGLVWSCKPVSEPTADYQRGYDEGYSDGYHQAKKSLSLTRLEEALRDSLITPEEYKLLKEEDTL